jgi:DNA repair protein RecO (recombination protein O)
MLFKTKGIVFRYTEYGESSIIVTIFTGLFGLQTYIVNSARTSSSKNKIALYQPLTLLDLVVYHRENASLLRIKEAKCFHAYQHIPVDFKKSSIALFLNEILNKTVKEQSHAEELCDFLIHSFVHFDLQATNIENFHLIFLIRLSRYLGFRPSGVDELMGGRVSGDVAEENLLKQLVAANYSDPISLSNVQRRNILEIIIRFYVSHSPNFGELKSLSVLREII